MKLKRLPHEEDMMLKALKADPSFETEQQNEKFGHPKRNPNIYNEDEVISSAESQEW